MKTLIIDADSWAYSMAHFHNMSDSATAFDAIESEDEAEFEGAVKDWAKEAVQQEIDRWMRITQCKDYQLHLSVGEEKLALEFERVTGHKPKPNFRYAVANDLKHSYKHNRPKESLEGASHVLSVIATEFNSRLHDEWEADDAVVAITREFSDNVLLCAIDKDVVNQVEGIHFNYRKLEPIVTDAKTVIHYPYWQALTGDPGDGYNGVPGVGAKKADAIIDAITFDDRYEEKLWRAVAGQYKIKGMDYKEAIATMRLASMRQLQITGGYIKQPEYHLELWQPPVELEW